MMTGIIKFEIKNRFTHWTIFLLYALLIYQGIWHTKGSFDYQVNDGLLMNSAAIFYENLAGVGLMMMIIAVVITGPVLFKELQHKTGQWLFTCPINEKKFFLSRFLAAFFINALLGLGYVVGMLLVPYSGIGEAHRFGPTPFGQLAHGYFFLLLPNLFLLTSMIFFALVYFRNMAASYLLVSVTLIFFIVMQTTAVSSGTTPLLLIGDSFGYVAVDHALDSVTLEERNFGYLVFSNYLMINRLLWLGLSVILLFLAYRKFSFKGFLKPPAQKKNKDNDTGIWRMKPASGKARKTIPTSFTLVDYLKKLHALSVLEIKNIVRPTGFKIIIGIVLLTNLLQNLLWKASFFLGATEPLTFSMTLFRLSAGVFIMVLLMVWAGELFFKDRTVGIWQITDALPVPVWTVTISRFIAMATVAFMLACTFILSGMFIQIIRGGAPLIDLKLYIYDLLGYSWGWLTYILQIATVFFIAGITKNRFATHIISVGIFFFTIVSFELGLAEQTIYAYAAVPGLEDFSEMNGYGIWMTAAKWYFLMWALMAICFVLAGVWFWQRGCGHQWWRAFSFTNKQLLWPGKIVLLVAFAGYVWTRMYIIDQVNGEGNFRLSAVEEKRKAAYEKKYARLKTIAQPKYRHIDLKFDFYPEERKATYEAHILLGNETGTSIDTLYLNWEDFVSIEQITLENQPLQAAWKDKELRIIAYPIPKSNQTDSVLNLKVQSIKQYVGFTQSGDSPQPDLMFNGSFGSVKSFLPTIGYDYARELKENRKRQDNGLAKLKSRMADVKNTLAMGQDAFAEDAAWVTGTIQLSTTTDQKAIAPGILSKKWTKNNRNYYLFQIIKPQPLHWFIGSANYAIKTTGLNGIKMQIMHDPKHVFNISMYEGVAIKAIKFVQSNFGNYPYKQLRIYEIPFYQDNFYSFPNAIAISEKEGWYAKTDAIKEKAYIYQTIASQVIKHWLYVNLKIANVQGADMLKIALPEALAMTFVEKELGKEALGHLIKKKNDIYAKDKNNEANHEPSLLYADGADYLEQNKGAIALYQTIKEMGTDPFLSKFIHWMASDNSYKTFESFMGLLKPQLKKQTYQIYLDG